ncbi:single-minded homolog 2-like, partial [Convolutriloba macropyga]|uniref:single-minded homolog 2-like n=1 Tax=Convolutriloba macropyga TaxID=536237 RepID=UPI003F525AD4
IVDNYCNSSTDNSTSSSGHLDRNSIYLSSYGDTFDLCFNKALDGFIMVVGEDCKLHYISENASSCLGLSQVEMLGNSLFDYTHPDDIPEVTKELFTKRETEHGNANIEREDETGMKNLNKVELEQSFDQGMRGERRKFTMRIKCVLAKRNAGLTFNGYKVIECEAVSKFTLKTPNDPASDVRREGMEIVARPLPCNSHNGCDLRIFSNVFIFRVSLFDLKIEFIDQRFVKTFNIDDWSEISFYNFVYPSDIKSVQRAHSDLIRCGQMRTEPYRILLSPNSAGYQPYHSQLGFPGFIWMQTDGSQTTSRSSNNCAGGIINNNNSGTVSGSRTTGVVLVHTLLSKYPFENEATNNPSVKKQNNSFR